jgi:heme/copper-type cytochrome/quinol oxidase subunit 3
MLVLTQRTGDALCVRLLQLSSISDCMTDVGAYSSVLIILSLYFVLTVLHGLHVIARVRSCLCVRGSSLSKDVSLCRLSRSRMATPL